MFLLFLPLHLLLFLLLLQLLLPRVLLLPPQLFLLLLLLLLLGQPPLQFFLLLSSKDYLGLLLADWLFLVEQQVLLAEIEGKYFLIGFLVEFSRVDLFFFLLTEEGSPF